MAIQPVKRTRAYEDIVRQLTEMVRRGELKAGDRLPAERELAASFGVGRPTLRQAITVLTQAGILEVRPGSGVYLAGPLQQAAGHTANNPMAMVLITENKSLRDILELRMGIEGEAAYLAALRRTPEHVAKLQQAIRDLDDAFEQRGVAIQEDYQFHYAVAEATGNPVFVKVMASLVDLFLQSFRETTRYFYYDPNRAVLNRQEHSRIMNAIMEQRPDDARAAMIDHLRQIFVRLDQAEQLVLDEPRTQPIDSL